MVNPVLSILIATMPKRKKSFQALISNLINQEGIEHVEILHDDSMRYNIGVKRNKLLQRAKGEMVVFADDDDHVAHNYIPLILEACKENCDCIGISGIITTNGKNEKQWHISKEFNSWYTKDNIYYRTPNHISPVRRELALKAGFPEIKFGEDYEYSMRLLPLLKTETVISGNIYWYKYTSKK
jgi:glycosyltransferase involved in cell wall biosynthesis